MRIIRRTERVLLKEWHKFPPLKGVQIIQRPKKQTQVHESSHSAEKHNSNIHRV